jgi:tRNA threonylcarbamoyladenosine biosynthesis protein TsaB
LALILNIDTATENASVCLSENNNILENIKSSQQKEHASFVHMAVESLMRNAGMAMHELDAVSITGGPGSYTGLRVAMASAKGFCYALSIPLISINTLKLMAFAALGQSECTLCCPMIDARRMEVFTALFDRDLNELVKSGPEILSEDFLMNYITENKIIFVGSGITKYQTIQKHINCSFSEKSADATDLAKLAFVMYQRQQFVDITYVEPQYLKSFYLTKSDTTIKI